MAPNNKNRPGGANPGAREQEFRATETLPASSTEKLILVSGFSESKTNTDAKLSKKKNRRKKPFKGMNPLTSEQEPRGWNYDAWDSSYPAQAPDQSYARALDTVAADLDAYCGSPEIVIVDFNADKEVKIQPLDSHDIKFRPRSGYHPRVGFTVQEYGEFQQHKLRKAALKDKFDYYCPTPQDALDFLAREKWAGRDDLTLFEKSSLWPHTGSATLSHVSENPMRPWAKPTARRHGCGLLELLGNWIIGDGVLTTLVQEGHFAMASLAATCQTAFRLCASFGQVWDIQLVRFNNCERIKPQSGGPGPDEAFLGINLRVVSERVYCADFKDVAPDFNTPENPQSRGDRVASAKARELCIDAAVLEKKQKLSPKNRDQYDSSGVTAYNQLTDPQHMSIWRPSYTDQLNSLQRAIESFSDYGARLQNLQLHRVSLLDYRGVWCLLSALPELVTLGIYQCEFLNLGHTTVVLDMVHNFNKKFGRHGNERLGLDFYPRFYQGASSDASLTYGISWRNQVGVPVQLGIFQILTAAGLKAEALGIDLFATYKAFRRFMERIPLHKWSVPDFIDTLLWYVAIHNSKTRQYTVLEKDQFLRDFICVVGRGLGDAQIFRVHPTATSIFLYMQWFYCSSCDTTMRSIFFTNYEAGTVPVDNRVCAGCLLRGFLDNQPSHCGPAKTKVLDSLFGYAHHQHVNKNFEDAPLLSNPLMAGGADSSLLPPISAGRAWTRHRKQYRDGLDQVPDAHAIALGSARRYDCTLSTLWELDVCSRLATLISNGVPPDGWGCKQYHMDTTNYGEDNQLCWEALVRKHAGDESNHHPIGDAWWLV